MEPRSYYVRGKSNFANAKFGLAVKNFGMALSRDPSSVEVLNGLAASYDRLGRFELATRYYYKALRIDPVSVQTINNIGYSFYLQGEVELAAKLLAKISGTVEADSVIAGNFRLARSAAANSRRDQCRPGAEGGSSDRGVSPSHGIRSRQTLRIVPVNSLVQRLVASTNSPFPPLATESLESTVLRKPMPRKANERLAARPWRTLRQSDCFAVNPSEPRHHDATEVHALETSMKTGPDAIDSAKSRHGSRAERVPWRGIEPRFDAMPKLFELEPTLIHPIKSGY